MDKFATRLQCLRKEAGLNQTELAEKLGASRASISAYENGDRTASIEFLAKAAEYFHVSTDWLLGLAEFPRMDPDLVEMIQDLSHAMECSLFAMEAAREAHGTLRGVFCPGGADNEG